MPAGTYYTAQIVDEWAEITYNINDRTFPDHPHGTFALCLAGPIPRSPTARFGSTSRRARPSCWLACRSATTSTQPSRCSTDSRCARLARRGSSRRSTAPTFTNTAATRRGDVRAARARSGACGAGPFRTRRRVPAALEQIAAFVAADPANARQIDELVAQHDVPRLHPRHDPPGRGRPRLALDRQPRPGSGPTTGSAPSRTSAGSGGTPPPRSSTTRCRPTRPDIRRPATTTTRSASPPANLPASTSTAIGRSRCTPTPTCDSCPTRSACTRSAYRTELDPRRRRRIHYPHRPRAARGCPGLELAAVAPGRATRGHRAAPLPPPADVLDGSWTPPAMTIER